MKFVKQTKQAFRKSRYLPASVSVMIVSFVLIIVDSKNFNAFFSRLVFIIFYTGVVGLGIALLSALSSLVLLLPFMPKRNDFANEQERAAYFSPYPADIVLLLLTIIAATLVLTGFKR